MHGRGVAVVVVVVDDSGAGAEFANEGSMSIQASAASQGRMLRLGATAVSWLATLVSSLCQASPPPRASALSALSAWSSSEYRPRERADALRVVGVAVPMATATTATRPPSSIAP
mmetsp:Transcript_7066/g.19277  ORF Transcript_7066/g.19277 Transcript_7066/m.19277 type:complete len:115 (-) Transcript_7066:16-360(-)